MESGVFCSVSREKRHEYVEYLRRVSALSNLFAESNTPYIDYRIIENLFCRCFGADNLARSCVSIDAKLNGIGVGIKTFVDTPNQKIAEFDADREYLNTGDILTDATNLAELRNERLELSRRSYSVDDLIYHYVVRTSDSLSIHECPMDFIDPDGLKVELSRGGFNFTDGINQYRFSRSKSTLYELFDIKDPLYSFGVEILDDPFSILREQFSPAEIIGEAEKERFIVLPLFSMKRGEPYVPEHSGLNQWNAAGRHRDFDEIYIPYNKAVRFIDPEFFPGRDVPFELELPDGRIISAKVCQDQGKAIMSNPNKDLGQWLLRDVLKLEEGQLVNIGLLDRLGINAVIFTKKDEGRYAIDFTWIDYEISSDYHN